MEELQALMDVNKLQMRVADLGKSGMKTGMVLPTALVTTAKNPKRYTLKRGIR